MVNTICSDEDEVLGTEDQPFKELQGGPEGGEMTAGKEEAAKVIKKRQSTGSFEVSTSGLYQLSSILIP